MGPHGERPYFGAYTYSFIKFMYGDDLIVMILPRVVVTITQLMENMFPVLLGATYLAKVFR